jgi:hypothetical protein
MMYALGNFAVEGNASPLFLLKMDVDVNPSTPSEVTTGIGDNAEPSSPFSLHLYPQPARDNLRLHIGGSSGTYRAEVFDMAGRRLLETVVDLRPSAADPEVELHNAPPGLYLMKVISENGRYTYAKFVKDQ